MEYVLARQLLTWRMGNVVQVGLSQEHSRTITGVEPFMIDFLRSGNVAKTIDGHISKLEDLSGEPFVRCEETVQNLVAEGILRRKLEDPEGRYSRHDLYYALTYGDGVTSLGLKNKSIAVIGVGGIGVNVAMALCTAGVGRLVLVDDDVVEVSNLTRQYLYSESDTGRLKVDVVREQLGKKNSDTIIEIRAEKVESQDSLAEIYTSVDLAIVSADSSVDVMNAANHMSVESGVPFMPAGYQDTVGVVGPLVVPELYESACLTCAEEQLSACETTLGDKSQVETCFITEGHQAPSFGPLNLMVAAISASESIRYLLTGESKLINSRVNISLSNLEMFKDKFSRERDCPDCFIRLV